MESDYFGPKQTTLTRESWMIVSVEERPAPPLDGREGCVGDDDRAEPG
jgi:hypothetical protein